MQNKFFRFLLFFLIFLVIFQLISGKKTKEVNKTDDIIITSSDKFVIGKEVKIDINNKSKEAIKISNQCPKNPLIVEFYLNGEWLKKEATLKDSSICQKQEKELTIKSGEKTTISYGLWNQDLFGGKGKYRITYKTLLDNKEKNYFHEIDISSPSLIRRGWDALLYKPILNTLFFFIAKIPGHSLGLAIILLTVLIKIILLGPNQKALKSQRQLQRVQPQLDALKQKYKNEPQKLAQETMAIWKKYKVSPMGSCLPMLIQFPILIALFYVVRDGLSVIDPNLFYAPLKSFNPQNVNSIFLGLIDLSKKNLIVLPIIVGGLQFLQIRLSFAKSSKALVNKDANAVMPMMNNMMQFFLPIMIAVFTAGLPAAVGFYWGISTVFAIAQQLVVNYSKD